MLTHLLVPLDGSKMAESVLPATIQLAQCLEARVSLVHVIEQDAPTEIHGEVHLRTTEAAAAYLEAIAQRALPVGTSVECHVHTSEVRHVARSIYDHIGELGSDLVVMCSHGRGGMHDLLFGSIAQQVIGLGITPVLIIRPPEKGQQSQFDCHRFLVPLDGDPEHEQGLPVARELAKACRASVHLLTVIHTSGTLSGQWSATGTLLPHATAEFLDMSVAKAEEYLQKHQTDLQAAAIEVTSEVGRGDPAQVIQKIALQRNLDLIILGTHGKKGTGAFWAGSVASRVYQSCRKPLLLVPVP